MNGIQINCPRCGNYLPFDFWMAVCEICEWHIYLDEQLNYRVIYNIYDEQFLSIKEEEE
jgi:uncharacterized protein (DUF983 family)